MNILTWWGCFANDVDKSLVTPESVKHPAKMAPLLTARIFAHLRDEYGLEPGDHVLDPFGGVGISGVIGARLGYNVTLIELEQFFYRCITGHDCTPDDLCPGCLLEESHRVQPGLPFARTAHQYHGNIWLYEQHSMVMGYMGSITAVQGDSTQLWALMVLNGIKRARAIVTSPPYADSVAGRGDGPGQRFDHKTHRKKTATKKTSFNGYGEESRQIGNLKGSDYWEMMSQVYAGCYEALEPGQPMALAIKPIIKNKKIIDLPKLTIQCLKNVGFLVPEMAKAMLIEPEVQLSLMDDKRHSLKAHESMWRRNSRKNGLAIDYEAVIFAVRP